MRSVSRDGSESGSTSQLAQWDGQTVHPSILFKAPHCPRSRARGQVGLAVSLFSLFRDAVLAAIISRFS